MSKAASSVADELVVSAVRLTRWLKAVDTAARLSGPQASALAIVVHAGKIRPSDLACLEQVKRPTIARIISELAEGGLIIRDADATDRRSFWISATEAGQRLIVEGQARRIEPLVIGLKALDRAELETLRQALPILRGLIDRGIAG